MPLELLIGSIGVVWVALTLLAVGLCMSARDGDRGLRDAAAHTDHSPAAAQPPVGV